MTWQNSTCYIRLCSICLLFLSIACQGSRNHAEYDSDTGELTLGSPEFLSRNRAVDVDKLQAEVYVNTVKVEGARQDNGIWRGVINVPPPSQLRIEVRWLEDVQDSLLLLAEADADAVPVTGLDPVRVRFLERHFDTSMDQDNDGYSNLRERRASTDPYDGADPAEPPARARLTVNILLPPEMQGLDINQIRVSAFINGINTDLNRQGSQWQGDSLETDGSRSSVVVLWDATAGTGGLLRVARSVGVVNISGDTVYQPAADTLNFNYDDDLDGTNNLSEILEGTG